MKIFTNRQWREHLAEHRRQLAKEPVPPTSYEERSRQAYRRGLDKIWARHSKPYPDGDPGDLRFGQRWWCSGCRTPWPCKDAQLVIQALSGDGPAYEPLRLSIVGERIPKDGTIKVGSTTMFVQGVKAVPEPTKPSEPTS